MYLCINRNARPNNNQLIIYYLHVHYLLRIQQYPVNNTYNIFLPVFTTFHVFHTLHCLVNILVCLSVCLLKISFFACVCCLRSPTMSVFPSITNSHQGKIIFLMASFNVLYCTLHIYRFFKINQHHL